MLSDRGQVDDDDCRRELRNANRCFWFIWWAIVVAFTVALIGLWFADDRPAH